MSTKTAPKSDSKALALVAQADAPEVLTPARKAELLKEASASAARFRSLHELIKIPTGQIKVMSQICGIEAAFLQDLHRELFGETRGGGVTKEAPRLGPWIEEQLDVTERTFRKHLNSYRAAAQARPELATKIVKAWQGWKDKKFKPAAIKPPKAGAKAKPTKANLTKAATTGIIAAGVLTAADLQELLTLADEWGLHELFEKPQRDVTEAPPAPPSNKQQSFDFWLQDFTARVLKDDYLKLPKTHREALLTTTKEMAAKLEDSLKAK